MDTQGQLETLLELAQNLEIEVRQVPLGGDGGGLCLLRGRRILFVDLLADPEDRLARTAAALAELDELEGRYLVPVVRELLERHRGP